MKKIIKRFLSLGLSISIAMTVIMTPNMIKGVEAEVKDKNYEIRPELEDRLPLYGGYYRTWHDVSSMGLEGDSNGGLVKMDDIPEAVDLVFVFDDWQHEKSPYYDKLKNEYVPRMQEKGQLIIRTIGTEFLYGATGIAKDKLDYYTNDEEGYNKLANDLVQTYVLDFNLDGLDVDVEAHNYSLSIISKEQRERIHGVLKALGTLIGPNGKNSDKLFIYDTTMGPENDAFMKNYHNFDLVLLQRYGVSGERGQPNFDGTYNNDLNETFEKFSEFISPKKIMIGFSNYEENSTEDNRWYDIPMLDNRVQKLDNENKVVYEYGDLVNSRAGKYASWQPSNGVKGGIFVYAIERDDVRHPSNGAITKTESDQKLPTEFNQSKELVAIQNKSDEYLKITQEDFPDVALRNLIETKVSKFKGDVKRFHGDLLIDDPKIMNLKGIELLENANLIIKNLPKLESLNLSGRGLEKLSVELDENNSNLAQLDISNNMLDLSKDTEARKVFDRLSKIVLNNNGNNNEVSAIKFGNQNINGYYPGNLGSETINLDVHPDGNYDLKTLLGKTVTAENTDISSKDKFESIKKETIFGRSFMSDETRFEDIKKDYSNFKITGMNSMRKKITSSIINLSEEESYFVNISNGTIDYNVRVNVGTEKELLENLALNAKYPLNPGYTQLAGLFDGTLHPSVALSFSAGFNYVFDIGEDAEVSFIRLYNASANKKDLGRKDNDLEKMRFEAFIGDKNPDEMKNYEKEVYLNDDSNWIEVARSDDAVEIWEESIEPIKSRYWRWHVDTVRDNKVANSYPMASELEFIGQRIDTSNHVIGPVNPLEVENPNKDDYWTVSFKAGKHGEISDNNTYYILKEINVILDDLNIPEIIENDGFVHSGWNRDLKSKISDDIELLAEYIELDNHKYVPSSQNIIKHFGQEITKEDIKNSIIIEGYDDTFTTDFEIEEHIQKAITSGEFELIVKIKYADDSEGTVMIPITIYEKVDKNALKLIIDRANTELLIEDYTFVSKSILEKAVQAGNLILVDLAATEENVKETISQIEKGLSNLSKKKSPELVGAHKSVLVKDTLNHVEIKFIHDLSSMRTISLNDEVLIETEDYEVLLDTNIIKLDSALILKILEISDTLNHDLEITFDEGPNVKEGSISYNLEVVETLNANTIYVADPNLNLGETKLIQVGEKNQIDPETQVVIVGEKENIVAVGNVEFGEKSEEVLESIIEEAFDLEEGKFELIEGIPAVTRPKTTFSIDEKTGKLINPKTEIEVISDGRAPILRVGKGLVKVYEFETVLINPKTIFKTDKSALLGQISIVERGKPGIMKQRYEITLENGEKTSKVLDQNYVANDNVEVIDEVISIGTNDTIYRDRIVGLKMTTDKLKNESASKVKDEVIAIESKIDSLLAVLTDTNGLNEHKLSEITKEITRLEGNIKSIDNTLSKTLSQEKEQKVNNVIDTANKEESKSIVADQPSYSTMKNEEEKMVNNTDLNKNENNKKEDKSVDKNEEEKIKEEKKSTSEKNNVEKKENIKDIKLEKSSNNRTMIPLLMSGLLILFVGVFMFLRRKN